MIFNVQQYPAWSIDICDIQSNDVRWYLDLFNDVKWYYPMTWWDPQLPLNLSHPSLRSIQFFTVSSDSNLHPCFKLSAVPLLLSPPEWPTCQAKSATGPAHAFSILLAPGAVSRSAHVRTTSASARRLGARVGAHLMGTPFHTYVIFLK